MHIDFNFWHPSLPNFQEIEAKLSNIDKKVRFIHGGWWHRPEDLDGADTDVDAVFWITDEILNHYHADVVKKPKNFFIVGGICQSLDLTDNIYCPWLTWFDRVVWANAYHPSPLDHREFLFDALLGLDKWHRSWVFDRLIESGLLDRSLVSMSHHADPTSSRRYESPDLHLYESDSINRVKQKKWTRCNGWSDAWNSQDPVEEHCYNHAPIAKSWQPSVSVLIPQRIYDVSWYSIICETQYQHRLYITEKTAKALMAQRIFVTFAAPGQLEFLRKQGYRTFDGIVDESYDQIEDNTERFRLAWHQVEYLGRSDPRVIYQQAREVLQHNHDRLMDFQTRQNQVEKFILDRLTSISVRNPVAV